MKRQSLNRKARRLLMTKGAIQITRAGYRYVEAIVKGDSGQYLVRISPEKNIESCTCPATKECSHILAVKLLWKPTSEFEIKQFEAYSQRRMFN